MAQDGYDNVILITSDTFRYDFFDPDFCPEIYQLAEAGVRFERAYSTGSGTSSAFPGILASSLPLDHGYRGLNDRHRPLAEQLSEQDVRTIGVTASSHASSLFNYHRGFDEFYEDPSYREDALNSPPLHKTLIHWLKESAKKNAITRELGQRALSILRTYDRGSLQYPYERAEAVTRKAIRAMEPLAGVGADNASFVWIHYMEPHSPYYPPDDILAEYHGGGWTKSEVHELLMRWYDNRQPLWNEAGTSYGLEDHEVDVLLDFYHAQIRYLDREVGRLIDWLAERGGLERTLLIFTSDHGEEFFDHGDFGHRQKVYDELIHVPFVAYGGRNSGISDEVVSHVDIAPTICDALGCEPSDGWRGTSLLPLIDGDAPWEPHDHVISELCHRSVADGYGGDVRLEEMIVAIIDEEWKFILNRQNDTRELYPSGADETRENDKAASMPEVADEYERIVRSRESDLSDISHERQEISQEVRERLHELGYTGE